MSQHVAELEVYEHKAHPPWCTACAGTQIRTIWACPTPREAMTDYDIRRGLKPEGLHSLPCGCDGAEERFFPCHRNETNPPRNCSPIEVETYGPDRRTPD